jgi:hypothetical protein
MSFRSLWRCACYWRKALLILCDSLACCCSYGIVFMSFNSLTVQCISGFFCDFSHCPCIDCNVMRGMMSSGLMGNDFGLQSQNETVLGYATGRPVTPPQFTYIDAQHLGLDGAGDGTGSHLFVPYIPAFE